uniref:Ovule protein n=1 Tax=Heterorhabditis bacteriophora TaxID=37862 RepID=A0A1I7WUX6_HETBA
MTMCKNSRKMFQADLNRFFERQNANYANSSPHLRNTTSCQLLLCQMSSASLNQIFHIFRNQFQATDFRRGHLGLQRRI